ncbi:glutamate--cysteine ligase [Mangrovibacterium lignilyticum]|uniref:glutamate--cysteine ligase n=1 Tax=Mangrovibacterium lignilyticum TaxID=2668052 RepID=UPI0013D1F435|nr:glutamate--cysteine ligase [Mangrovibacterium lignilyticum]
MTEIEKKIAILNKSQLIDYFVQGCTPFDDWGIGTEHEKFLYRIENFKRLGYNTESGISTILKHMQTSGWEPIMEKEFLIGLQQNGASITLEPGGQFELSGKNFKTIHHTFIETKKHFEELRAICQQFGFFSLPMGVDPLWKVQDIPWMPKKRYAIMKEHMPTKGNLGLEMMANTATIQVNLDYASEKDMIQKMRVAQALQPFASAIFANSPFSEGKPNGYLSYRTQIWNDTDPDRCGFQSFIFDESFGFERWVDYLLDIPMYFIYRDGEYLSANGITFREFMNGKHQLSPTMEDWEIHCSTVFPDVRLKQYIEMRGADASCVKHIAALSAFWVGLLYDEESRNEAMELISGWDINEIQEIRDQVPVKGLKASSKHLDAGKISKYLYTLASAGLTRRAKRCGTNDESQYLDPVRCITNSGITQAERLLDCYRDDFNSDLIQLLENWRELQLQSCPS